MKIKYWARSAVIEEHESPRTPEHLLLIGGSDGSIAHRPVVALVVGTRRWRTLVVGGVGTRERTAHCAAAAAGSVDTRYGLQHR